MNETILSIQNLKVNYGGIEAVKGISFDVPEGSIVTLIGANGAGKSSTLRSIVGLVKPAGGKIIFRGDERKKIRDFLSQLPILQGEFAGTIGLFDEQAKIITRYEGDRISGDMLEKNFIFVGKFLSNFFFFLVVVNLLEEVYNSY